MPRKNARPAARKRQEKLNAKLAQKARFDAKARPILANPRHGDGVLLAALAAGIFNQSK
ncbi:hypothetical protein IQ03_02210 [Gemmobacter caeni]|uniref:Uncharacterized protein n=1 Tax=Gemmobacter caeni TaxID=589035 RepID=A0A2T6AY10_9RHOB|nr:hypothetical protein [Gemmobacter caeni]PTX48704.1 hypothetical protein C8N34_109214 [Gemmobacter caeni]TWI99496.1 hypothetical protein IQ03_02210 [Gemmobacter caeni]